jgi:hypothetical protein
MTVYRAAVDDNNSPLPSVLNGVDSLAGGTVVARLKRVPDGEWFELAVEVISVTDRTVRLVLPATAIETPNDIFRLKWRVTYPDATKLTWPTRGTDYLLVGP